MEETLMCLVGQYWRSQGVQKKCKDWTHDERVTAFKVKYADHIKDGKWTFEQFIDWFPASSVPMTKDEVREFAESIR